MPLVAKRHQRSLPLPLLRRLLGVSVFCLMMCTIRARAQTRPINLRAGSTLYATVATDGATQFPICRPTTADETYGFSVRIAIRRTAGTHGHPYNIIGLYPIREWGPDPSPVWALKVNAVGEVYGAVGDTAGHSGSVSTGHGIGSTWEVWALSYNQTGSVGTLTIYSPYSSCTKTIFSEGATQTAGTTLTAPSGLLDFRIGDLNATDDYQVAEISVWNREMLASEYNSLSTAVVSDSNNQGLVWYSRPVLSAYHEYTDKNYVYRDRGSAQIDLKAVLKGTNDELYYDTFESTSWLASSSIGSASGLSVSRDPSAPYTADLVFPANQSGDSSLRHLVVMRVGDSTPKPHFQSGMAIDPGATTCVVSGLVPGAHYNYSLVESQGNGAPVIRNANDSQYNTSYPANVLDTMAEGDAPSSFGISWNKPQGSDINSSSAPCLKEISRVARTELFWSDWESHRSSFTLPNNDCSGGSGCDTVHKLGFISSLLSAEITPLILLDYGNPLYDPTRSTYSLAEMVPWDQTQLDALSRWVHEVVSTLYTQVGSAGLNKVVWEAWNEPGCGARTYSVYFNTIASAIRSEYHKNGCTKPTIICGSMPLCINISGDNAWTYPWDFVADLGKEYTWNGKLYPAVLTQTDAFSVHPYRHNTVSPAGSSEPDYYDSPESTESEYRQLRYLMNRALPTRNVPIVSGEWGYSLDAIVAGQEPSEQEKEAIKAQFMARQRLFNMAYQIPMSIWFDWRIDDQGPYSMVDASTPPNKLPAYTAAKTQMDQLDGYKFDHFLALPPTAWPQSVQSDAIYAMLFRNAAGNGKLAMWTDSSTSISVPDSLPSGLSASSGKTTALIDATTYEDKSVSSTDIDWLKYTPTPTYYNLTTGYLADADWTWLKPHDVIAAGMADNNAGVNPRQTFTIRNTADSERWYIVEFGADSGSVYPLVNLVVINQGGCAVWPVSGFPSKILIQLPANSEPLNVPVSICIPRNNEAVSTDPPDTNCPQVPRVVLKVKVDAYNGNPNMAYDRVGSDAGYIPIVLSNPMHVTVSNVVQSTSSLSTAVFSGTVYVQVDTGTESIPSGLTASVTDGGGYTYGPYSVSSTGIAEVPVNSVCAQNGYYTLHATVFLGGQVVASTPSITFQASERLNFATGNLGPNYVGQCVQSVYRCPFLRYQDDRDDSQPKFFHLRFPFDSASAVSIVNSDEGALSGRSVLRLTSGYRWDGLTDVSASVNNSPYQYKQSSSGSRTLPDKVGMWVRGTGRNESLFCRFRSTVHPSSQDNSTWVTVKSQAAYRLPVSWTGWRWITMDVPPFEYRVNGSVCVSTRSTSTSIYWEALVTACNGGTGCPITANTANDAVDLMVADITPITETQFVP